MALQNGNTVNFLHGHIVFEGKIKCLSGLHIKGATETIEIGGIDSYVIRNPLTNEPYIPGSSIKGKLRSIVEKIVVDEKTGFLKANRSSDTKDKIWRHECDDYSDAKDCPLCRVFGSTGKASENDNHASKLIVNDSMLMDKESLMRDGLYITEAKMENTLDRLTSAATPRTIERIPEGTEFKFKMIYKIETNSVEGKVDSNKLPETVNEDIKNLMYALQILEKDGIGGSISRGYGRVEIEFKIEVKKTDGSTMTDAISEDNLKLIDKFKNKN